LKGYIASKFRGRRIDVVIAMTDAVLRFVLDHRARLFPDAPIVYMGLEIPDEIARAADSPLTGVLVGTAYLETLKVALALHPSTRQVFIVAKTGSQVRQQVLEHEFQRSPGHVKLTYINERSVHRLLAVVKAVPRDSVILYLWHQPDEYSNFVYPDTTARLVAQSAPVPVYGTSDFYVGLGVVGGVLRRTGETGIRLGQMTRRLLDGARPRDIPVERARLVPIFDSRQLRRWGIDESKLPVGSDVRFRTPTAWESYRPYVVASVFVIGAQLLLIAGLLAQRSSRRRAEETIRTREASLRTSYERIRQLAGRLINAQEAARAGIARDLHDDVCQQLAFVAITVGTLKSSSGAIQDAKSQQALAELEQRTQGLFDGIRRLSHDLHPASLRLLGLAPALKTYCREVADHQHVRVDFESEGDIGGLHPDVSVCLFRIAQESLRNGVVHGHARKFVVSLARTGERVDLMVTDDGQGFELEASRWEGSGLGLVSMQERARVVGGTVEVTTAPGQGTTVRVSCPAAVPASSPAAASSPADSPEAVGYAR
jgi:signal transduction histidine kinase